MPYDVIGFMRNNCPSDRHIHNNLDNTSTEAHCILTLDKDIYYCKSTIRPDNHQWCMLSITRRIAHNLCTKALIAFQ